MDLLSLLLGSIMAQDLESGSAKSKPARLNVNRRE